MPVAAGWDGSDCDGNSVLVLQMKSEPTQTGGSARRFLRKVCVVGGLACLLTGTDALGQAVQFLEPSDRSSPRAALKTFLNSMDEVGIVLAEDYYSATPSSLRQTAEQLARVTRPAIRSLDMSEIPPVSRARAGKYTAAALYEVLSRIELPPDKDIPFAEDIGMRSTRIRGLDRTVAVIPNAMLSKIPLINYSQRDRMLIRSLIGVRYETTPDQLRFLLAKIRELLLAHPRITPEPSRVRFMGFGASSLNLEVYAYADTTDWGEFLAIREDVNLRIMEIITTSGTSVAFPSQTLYLNRDTKPDPGKSKDAADAVAEWRQSGNLPFPDFDLEFRQTRRDTLDYPPTGSPHSKQPPEEDPSH